MFSDTQPGDVRGERLSAWVATRLREMVITGQVRDERLRAEHLADELNVSATPVREALMTMAGEGLVEFRPGRGFRIGSLTRQDVLDVYDMQAYVAGILATRAIPMLTSAQIGTLERLQSDLQQAFLGGELAAVATHDFEFHRLINRTADSPKLRWITRLTLHYVPFGVHALVPGWPEAARDDHVPLLHAIMMRSPNAARDFMQAHIRHAGDLLADFLASRGVLDD